MIPKDFEVDRAGLGKPRASGDDPVNIRHELGGRE